MAEAHSAVAFGFSVSHDGVSVSFDQELLRNIWHSISHSYKRRIGKFKNNFYTGIYPATPTTLVLSILVFVVPRLGGMRLDRGGIEWLEESWGLSWVPTAFLRTTLAAALFGAFVWFLIVQAIRLFVKSLFEYKAFMFEPRGKMSLKTKLWLYLVKIVGSNKPMLNSFQGSLPRLPLPKLNDTLDKHLKSVRPLVSDEEYEKMKEASDEFRCTLGPKFQRYLLFKAWFSSNYVTDWWEQYVYLRGRAPIMVNSNYYGLDTLFAHPTKKQAARAANIVYAALKFRRQLHRQDAPPIMSSGVPLCSAQYERLFNTTRVPGEESDHLRRYETSKHVAVFHKGAWYKLPVHTSLRLLTPAELQYNIQAILDLGMEYVPSIGEERLAALTAGSRAPWGRARKDFFKAGLNKNSLKTIESAAFVLCLDTEEHNYDPEDPAKLDRWARSLLHGKGNDRWYDKSFNIIVSANGRVGANAEHSWGDAPIMAHLLEYLTYKMHNIGGDAPIMAQLFENSSAMEHHELGYAFPLIRILPNHGMRTVGGAKSGTGLVYTEEGDVKGTVEVPPPAPERLRWEISEACQEVIDASFEEARALGNTVDMALLVFQDYGKGFMKKIRCSPDAYIQMALQCTYYQMEGKFPLTYEASMTRLYREGRTETVRSLTCDTAAFIRAYLDPNSSDEERLRLMYVASDSHTHNYRSAMCGMGLDRHLFALYVVSKYLELDSPFLHKVITSPWILSTSQTPHQQTNLLDLAKHPELTSAGGGFGPVSDNGYGVSYIIGGEDIISFHISSKTTCPSTDSARFRATLQETMSGFRRMAESGIAKGVKP